ncbi:MAG: 50S ribosomal protein L23 [Planctomycetota bacterium]|jgi:large subunit ribosomal protein L23
MEPTIIIKKPLITEKSTFQSSETNRYAFQVEPRATKPQIKLAVEKLYGVRVVSVSTQNRPGKVRRFRYGAVRTPATKRALVKIHPDDRIELF